jgi:CNT family concentrative nucleoside transporter
MVVHLHHHEENYAPKLTACLPEKSTPRFAVILISLLGYCMLITCAWLCSTARTKINWRTIAGAIAIQFAFGALVLYVPAGKIALERLAELVATVIAYGDDGIGFLFGGLNDPSQSLGFIFAFKVLPVIIFSRHSFRCSTTCG